MPQALIHPRPPAPDEATFPVLRSLGLSDAQWLALRSQGFVRGELRRARVVFKLRFRLAGRQQVKFLGSDRARADQAVRELLRWQQARQTKRCDRRFQREVRQRLREAKQALEPIVAAAGLRFHGRAIRRPRQQVTGGHPEAKNV